ncbi:hypothetical protein SAMN04488503_0984 [Humidesulfovibrio mexicanus]|uniref:Uncharacterized protein n=1 Tax=Humidesulfovibrio mexicanus TaxID=147047 RepID=A0A238YUF2_9BACT|nr:hypothetical protein [Humidesulfovibrio mexicanus]SNR74418.1 hypothetical protein SAMN04488503_0984 [Humidesulfovibrio mexicanus]
MNRREFFCRFVPFLGQAVDAEKTSSRPEHPARIRLTENERFLRAMAMGIDPATMTPGQLKELVPDPEPQTPPQKQERLDSEA